MTVHACACCYHKGRNHVIDNCNTRALVTALCHARRTAHAAQASSSVTHSHTAACAGKPADRRPKKGGVQKKKGPPGQRPLGRTRSGGAERHPALQTCESCAERDVRTHFRRLAAREAAEAKHGVCEVTLTPEQDWAVWHLPEADVTAVMAAVEAHQALIIAEDLQAHVAVKARLSQAAYTNAMKQEATRAAKMDALAANAAELAWPRSPVNCLRRSRSCDPVRAEAKRARLLQELHRIQRERDAARPRLAELQVHYDVDQRRIATAASKMQSAAGRAWVARAALGATALRTAVEAGVLPAVV